MIALARHSKAYPSLDVIKALKAAREGRILAPFYDQAGRLMGEIFIKTRTAEALWIECCVFTPYTPPFQGEVGFRLVRAPNGVDDQRAYTLCPGCRARARILYCIDSWACRYCHKLHRRSQLVSAETRLWERKDALYAKIGGGRPARMHNSTYRTLRAELDLLEERLRGRRRTYASDVHDLAIRSEWIRPADHQHHGLFNPYFRIHGNKIVMASELDFQAAREAERTVETPATAPQSVPITPAVLTRDSQDGTDEDWLGDGPVQRF